MLARRSRSLLAVLALSAAVGVVAAWSWGWGASDPVDDAAVAGSTDASDLLDGPWTLPLDLGPQCTMSSERVCVQWPYAFVDTDTGLPIAGNGVNLQDAVDPHWHLPIDRLSAPGSPAFDLVRVALNWPQFETAPGVFDQAAFGQLDQLIAAAGDAGLAVVLDPIHLRRQRQATWDQHPGSTWNIPAWAWERAGIEPATEIGAETEERFDCSADQVLAATALGYLREVVRRYADEPTVIAVDLVNEPRNSCWGMPGQAASGPEAAQALLDLQLAWVDELRRIDPDKVLIVEPMYGDYDPARLDLSGFASRENLVWSVHDYYSGAGPVYGPSGVAAGSRAARYDLDDVDRDERRRAMAAMLTHVLETLGPWEIPVFVGEYGYVQSSPNGREALADKRDVYDGSVDGRGFAVARAYWVMNHDRWGFELFTDGAWSADAAVLTHGTTR